MLAVRRNGFIELLWGMHRWLYEVSGGRLGSRLPGQLPVLLLTAEGRKSGRPRTHPLGYLTVEDGYVVVASNAGEPRQPGWYHNLKSNPEATVQVGSRHANIRAREAVGEERERLWGKIISLAPAYSVYQEQTKRLIPVMVLETQSQGSGGAKGCSLTAGLR